MFIFYQNPYYDIVGAICGIAALMAIAGWGMSAIDDVYKVKDSLNIGVALVSTTIMLITMCILPFTDKTKDIALSSLDSNVPLSRISEQVHVTDSKVVIDKLPENIRYEPKQFQGVKERQIFVFSYDETFEVGKLTSASGETFVLLDEDTKLLKERGAK